MVKVISQDMIDKGFLGKKHNFINCSFAGLNLENLNLQNRHFHNCNFDQTKIVNTKLKYASFTGSKSSMVKTKFLKCNMTSVSLSKLVIDQASFVECNFKSAKFSDSEFINATFQSCKMKFSSLQDTTLNKCEVNYVDFELSDLKSVKFINSTINDSSFIGSNFNGTVTFKDTKIQNTLFMGAESVTGKDLFDNVNFFGKYIYLDFEEVSTDVLNQITQGNLHITGPCKVLCDQDWPLANAIAHKYLNSSIINTSNNEAEPEFTVVIGADNQILE